MLYLPFLPEVEVGLRQNMGFLWRCVEEQQQPRFGLSKVESSKSASKKYANEMRAENSVGTGH